MLHSTFTPETLYKILKEKGLDCTEHDDKSITLTCWGFELVLGQDGTYYVNDTSGG